MTSPRLLRQTTAHEAAPHVLSLFLACVTMREASIREKTSTSLFSLHFDSRANSGKKEQQ